MRDLVRQGRRTEAEPDPDRLRRWATRKIDKITPPGAESLIGATIDFQPAAFLVEGFLARNAVAYVEVNTPTYQELGSGFMISPKLFLTNQHVIVDENAARGTLVTFDREINELGRMRQTTSFFLDPDTFALFSDQSELDYALIAVGQRNVGDGELASFGFCPLMNSPDRHVIGMNVNIVQHPRGLPKMIAVRNNLLTERTPIALLYETDTEQGSSGAPVFNDEWDVIALHHWGQPFLAPVDGDGEKVSVNEGVRISAIFNHLTARLNELPSQKQQLLTEALSWGERTNTRSGGPILSPPRPGSSGTESMHRTLENGEAMAQISGSNELKVTLPIEITIRVGGPATGGQVGGVRTGEVVGIKTLIRGSEAVKIDTNYTNRDGYNEDFIAGHTLQLPQPKASLIDQVAPLRTTEPNAAAGELKYEHFSIKLNKNKRIAMFTATNIDGQTYLEVDRETGQVGGSEGETWYKDPRISEAFFLNQSFYSEWSTYFDRGHLTRRTDPTWGTEATAERANADTFHFTNCSPQHFRFNQTTRYWQGAERFILENGLLSAESGKHICVFQGPIFDDAIDLWADDVQIASSFFKIVVWEGQAGLKSVGLIVDQLPLLSEVRINLGPPHAVANVNVNQWRVPISLIETRTKLDFGQNIRNADTSSQAGQPIVGGEAAKPIRSLADILA